MPHTFRKFISCGARVSKDGAAEERFRGASCFETHRSAAVLLESHCGEALRCSSA